MKALLVVAQLLFVQSSFDRFVLIWKTAVLAVGAVAASITTWPRRGCRLWRTRQFSSRGCLVPGQPKFLLGQPARTASGG